MAVKPKSKVLKAGQESKFVVHMYVAPEPNQDSMRRRVGDLLASGLGGVTDCCGRLKVTVEYEGKRADQGSRGAP